MNFLKKLFNGEKREQVDNLGRNDQCWCGSGKKYKRCHLDIDGQKKSNKLAKSNYKTPRMSM